MKKKFSIWVTEDEARLTAAACYLASKHVGPVLAERFNDIATKMGNRLHYRTRAREHQEAIQEAMTVNSKVVPLQRQPQPPSS